MKYSLIVVLLVAQVSFGQQKVLSTIPLTGNSIASFIPAGYDTLATATGDLNKDSVSDVAMVLFNKLEDSDDSKMDPDSLPARLLIILFKKGNQYSLAGKSDSAILCKGCGGVMGDPFAGIYIKRGVLVIDHFGGSAWKWSYTHRFRYQDNDFFLIGKTSNSFWGVKMCDKLKDFAGTDFEDINYVTGQFEKKKISEECKLLVNQKGKAAKQPLKKLEGFSIEN